MSGKATSNTPVSDQVDAAADTFLVFGTERKDADRNSTEMKILKGRSQPPAHLGLHYVETSFSFTD